MKRVTWLFVWAVLVLLGSVISVAASDDGSATAYRGIPSSSAGVTANIPRIDLGDMLGTGDWNTLISVQNPTGQDTGVIFFGWGEYSGLCPATAPGPIEVYSTLLPKHGSWRLGAAMNPDVKSGIIYSVNKKVFPAAVSAATPANWSGWVQEWEDGTCFEMTWGDATAGGKGENIAVTVDRSGPNDFGSPVFSAYTGISENMEDSGFPYGYFVPRLMHGYNGWDSEMAIQNAGDECTSMWINYKEEGNCEFLYAQHIEQLAPGEAIRLRVPSAIGQLPCYWTGSAFVRATEPLAIIVDETSFDEPCASVDQQALSTYNATPFEPAAFAIGTRVYAPLFFREARDWSTAVDVQNHTLSSLPTYGVAEFLDREGVIVDIIADWICRNGSAPFTLPSAGDCTKDLGAVGAVSIESLEQEAPEILQAQPITAVVTMENLATGQKAAYNGLPASKALDDRIFLPRLEKDGTDTEITIADFSPLPHPTDTTIRFYDEMGRLDHFEGFFIPTLFFEWPPLIVSRNQMVATLNVNKIRQLPRGWVGSAVISTPSGSEIGAVVSKTVMGSPRFLVTIRPDAIVVEGRQRVTVKARNERGGQIRGATVTLFGCGIDNTRRTAWNGVAVFGRVTPSETGTIEVTVTKDGYPDDCVGSVTVNEADFIVRPARLVIKLARVNPLTGTTIGVTVKNATSRRPAVGAQVRVFGCGVDATQATDLRGKAVFANVKPNATGTIQVQVSKNGYNNGSGSILVVP